MATSTMASGAVISNVQENRTILKALSSIGEIGKKWKLVAIKNVCYNRIAWQRS